MIPWKIITGACELDRLHGQSWNLSCTDHWNLGRGLLFIKRRRVDIADLHHPKGRYHYSKGINWRSMLVMLCSIAPTMPGLAKNLDSGDWWCSLYRRSGVVLWLFGQFPGLYRSIEDVAGEGKPCIKYAFVRGPGIGRSGRVRATVQI
jgi:hypothetical protein